MFFFYVFAVFMFLASTIQVRLKHKTKPYLDIEMIWSLSKVLTWREGFSFDLCLRPSQANLSSVSDVYVSPGFNLLPVFWRSLIFLFGSWRRVRGSADPRCVSYRFKLVFYEFSQMRPQLARILRWGTGIVFALAEVTLELTTEIRSVFDIGPGRPVWTMWWSPSQPAGETRLHHRQTTSFS